MSRGTSLGRQLTCPACTCVGAGGPDGKPQVDVELVHRPTGERITPLPSMSLQPDPTARSDPTTPAALHHRPLGRGAAGRPRPAAYAPGWERRRPRHATAPPQMRRASLPLPAASPRPGQCSSRPAARPPPGHGDAARVRYPSSRRRDHRLVEVSRTRRATRDRGRRGEEPGRERSRSRPNECRDGQPPPDRRRRRSLEGPRARRWSLARDRLARSGAPVPRAMGRCTSSSPAGLPAPELRSPN